MQFLDKHRLKKAKHTYPKINNKSSYKLLQKQTLTFIFLRIEDIQHK